MNPRESKPLDADLEDLLEVERDRPRVDSLVRDRVLSRVEATLGLGGFGGSGGPPPIVPPQPPPPPIPGGADLPATSAATAKAISAATTATGLFTGGAFSKSLLVGLAALAVGGTVIGGILEGSTSSSPPAKPAVAIAPAIALPASSAESADESPADAGSIERGAADPAPTAIAPPRASADEGAAGGHDESLAAERKLLDSAHAALAGGRSTEAFDALQRHARDFPRGRLSEEREALWIQALIGAGKRDEARQRASRFRKIFPRSMLLPALQAALGEIP